MSSNVLDLPLPIVSEYLDYRLYLSDFFKFKKDSFKNHLTPYTTATFAAASGIKSPQYLKLIIEGERNLSEKSISQFSKALGLKKEETLDFRLLVLSNQETDPSKRSMLLKELMDYRVAIKLKNGQISPQMFDSVPDWVAWVLYEVTQLKDVSFDVKFLQKLLRSKASAHQIQKSLNALVTSGLLVNTPDQSGYSKGRLLTEQSDQIPVELVRHLQAELMFLALDSLYQDSPSDREFGSATMALTQSEFEEVRFKLRQLRKSLQKDNSSKRTHELGERVYQLNMQLYPVTEAPLIKSQEQGQSQIQIPSQAEAQTESQSCIQLPHDLIQQNNKPI